MTNNANKQHPISGFIIRNKKLGAVFIIAAVLFNYPIIALVNIEKSVFDIPVLYLFLFVVWIGVILVTLLINHFQK